MTVKLFYIEAWYLDQLSRKQNPHKFMIKLHTPQNHTYTMSRTSIAPIVYPTDGKIEIGTARISFH